MAHALVAAASQRQQTTAFYDKAAGRYARYAARFDMEATLGGFFSTITREHRVLDVGCGSGRDLHALEERAGVSVGLDLSCGLLSEARRTSKAPVVNADAAHLPIPDETFDRVMAIASLHHLPRKAQIGALKEMRRVLRRDGEAFVTLKVGRGKRCDGDAETGQQRFFYLTSPRTFDRRARRCGLVVASSTTSTAVRHGHEQVWHGAWLRVGPTPAGVPPIRRLRAALRRRSSAPGPSNRRHGPTAT